MVIESRTIVGGAAALAIVGVGLWVSTMMLSPSTEDRGTVEVRQIVNEPAWTVEVTELGSEGVQQTASR